MNANELMIGDWVMADHPVRIDMLSNEDVVTYQDVDGYKVVPTRKLNPIPLTPEILEKNGFFVDRYEEECVADYTFIKKPIYRYDEGTDFAIEFDGWALRIINDFPEREISINSDTSEKLFVHELQHALHLCGIEKDIIV